MTKSMLEFLELLELLEFLELFLEFSWIFASSVLIFAVRQNGKRRKDVRKFQGKISVLKIMEITFKIVAKEISQWF